MTVRRQRPWFERRAQLERRRARLTAAFDAIQRVLAWPALDRAHYEALYRSQWRRSERILQTGLLTAAINPAGELRRHHALLRSADEVRAQFGGAHDV